MSESPRKFKFRARNKKISAALRESLIARMLSGEITRRQASTEAGVGYPTVCGWLLARDIDHLVPRLGRRVPKNPALRARLTKHLLAGEITLTEASNFYGALPRSVLSWPEMRGVKYSSLRDIYLRKLFPDLTGGNKPPNPSPADGEL